MYSIEIEIFFTSCRNPLATGSCAEVALFSKIVIKDLSVLYTACTAKCKLVILISYIS